VGGLVARGLAGGYRQRYLGVRDQLIGIQLLRSDGVAARAGGRVVKNVAGYDLMRLFTGSWGSLGLITAVTLRTLPLPPARAVLLLQGTLPDLAGLARWLLASSLTPERIDWWSAPLAAAAGLEKRPLLLIGLGSVNGATLGEQVRCIRARCTSLTDTTPAAADREQLLARARGVGTGAAASPWLLRPGVDPAAVDRLLAAPELEGLAVEMAAGGGLGLAWCLRAGEASGLPGGRVAALRRRCRALGGHLTVLHQPEGSDLTAWEDAPSRALIETVKQRFDPLGQLAPGRLPGVAAPVHPSASPLTR
jgi:glycolate oxidase FAD binding subunit